MVNQQKMGSGLNFFYLKAADIRYTLWVPKLRHGPGQFCLYTVLPRFG